MHQKVDTKLHCALRSPLQKETAALLRANGADVNARGEYGDTPLQSALYEGCTEIATLLIAKGADVNTHGRRTRNYPAPRCRPHFGKTQIAAWLIEKRASRKCQ